MLQLYMLLEGVVDEPIQPCTHVMDLDQILIMGEQCPCSGQSIWLMLSTIPTII